MTDIVETIAEYLSMGGLFNPEMMEHDTVRNLIIECRAEITRLRAENERLSTSLSNTANARVLQGKVIVELSAENERLRWMVRRLQERTRQLIQDNKLLAHDDTAEWGLEELMKDVGDTDE